MKKMFLVLRLVVLMVFVVSCAPTGQAYQFGKKAEKVPDAEKINIKNKIPNIITCPKIITRESPYFKPNSGESVYPLEDKFASRFGIDKEGVLWTTGGINMGFKSRFCEPVLFSTNKGGSITCYYEDKALKSNEDISNTFLIRSDCPNAKPHTDDSCECN